MNYLKISLGIIAVLAASRWIPHPPNFTSLIALSFYVPIIFGLRYIPSLLLAFFITDIFLGFHSTMFFTYSSIICISLISNLFSAKFIYRIIGCLFGAIIFFVISNFGVWISGFYGYSLEGLILCYVLAIPFFYGIVLSSFLYGILIELLLKFKLKENKVFRKI